MQEVEDEPLFAERVAGIDIAKAGIDGHRPGAQRHPAGPPAAGDPGVPGHPQGPAGTGGLAAVLGRDQGRDGGNRATTGSRCTSCSSSEGFDCVLYHAAQVKALPGRPKTDKQDSVWLAKITERGSLPSSFVPPEDIRRLRTHTRYRRHLTQARTAENAASARSCSKTRT